MQTKPLLITIRITDGQLGYCMQSQYCMLIQYSLSLSVSSLSLSYSLSLSATKHNLYIKLSLSWQVDFDFLRGDFSLTGYWLSLTCISCISCCHPVLSRGSFCMRGHSNLLLYIYTVFLTNSLNIQKHDNLMYKARKARQGAGFRVVTFPQKHSRQNDNMTYIFYNLLQINSLQL